MTTMKDIANLAHVDVSTVSRALNGKGYVHPATRQKIMDAVEQLSYKPNLLVKGVKKGKRKTICVIVPSLLLNMFGELTQLIEETARKYDYEIMIMHTKDDPDYEKACLERIRESYVDGVLIAATGQNQGLLRDIHISDLPVVQIVRQQSRNISSVVVDFFSCGYKGAHYLINQGCKKIGLINGFSEITPFNERYKGYHKAMAELNLDEYVINNSLFNSSYFKSGYESIPKLLKLDSDIDGILLANDLLTMGAIRALKELKIKIPDEIKILSLTGHTIGDMLETRITSMEMPLLEIAEKSVEMLFKQINNSRVYGSSSVEHLTLNTTLTIRETT